MKRVLSLTFRGKLFAVGSLFFFAPYTCLPYSYISPLQKLPGAEEVVAFANWPWRPPYSLPVPDGIVWNSHPLKRIQLSQNDLLKFLQVGRLETNSHSIPSKTEFVFCRGMFFTAKRQEYYWHLGNERTLFVWDHHSHLAALTLEDGCQPILSYTTNKFLIVPRRTNILALVLNNNILRNRSPFTDRTNRPGDKMMKPENNQNGKAKGSWSERALIPPHISEERLLKFINAGRPIASSLRKPPFRGDSSEESGAIVLTSGKICFFDIWGPRALYLETEDGASCVIELPN